MKNLLFPSPKFRSQPACERRVKNAKTHGNEKIRAVNGRKNGAKPGKIEPKAAKKYVLEQEIWVWDKNFLAQNQCFEQKLRKKF